jgi:ribulose-bisphosphate carboxylase large chain
MIIISVPPFYIIRKNYKETNKRMNKRCVLMGNYEEFVNLSYKPKPSDMIVSFKVKVPRWEKPLRAYGAVASESSVGTWANLKNSKLKHVEKVAGKVFQIERGGWIKVAYPYEHFEKGNMPQILASIAGNVFGMKAVDALRLQDISFPEEIVKSFPGPKYGIKGIRKIFNENKRPLLLSVPKPKVGLTVKEHSKIGYDIWTGGLDLLKDDENLAGQTFNPFKERVEESLKFRDKAEKETGEKKSYLINVTCASAKELERRVKIVSDNGGEYAMIDIITAGWLGVSTLRDLNKDYNVAIHAHRAMHAAMSRNPDHGFSMLSIAKVSRLLGVDQLHIGTAGIGKLEGGKDWVLKMQKEITEDKVDGYKLQPDTLKGTFVPEDPKLHTLSQKWYGVKPVFPVASGGLHPLLMYDVLDSMGTDIMVQLGGGIHGHPKGSYSGAKASRAALDAYMEGKTLHEAIKSSKELKEAYEKWGKLRPR